MHVDGGDGAVEMVQLDLDAARNVNAELEYLIGRGGHLELVIRHRVHVQLVGGVAGDVQRNRLADSCLQGRVGRRDLPVRDGDVDRQPGAAGWFRRTTAPGQCRCRPDHRQEHERRTQPDRRHAAFGVEWSNAGSCGCGGAVSFALIRPAPQVSTLITVKVKNSTTIPPAVNSHAGTPGSRSRCRIDTSKAKLRVPLVNTGISGTGIAESAGAQIGTAARSRPRWFCILPCQAKIVTQSGWSPAMLGGLSWTSADAKRCPGGLGRSVNLM